MKYKIAIRDGNEVVVSVEKNVGGRRKVAGSRVRMGTVDKASVLGEIQKVLPDLDDKARNS